MEIKNIRGGKDFSIVKFKDKLGYATKYNSFKDKRDNILKVVRSSQESIRAGRFNSAAAMARMKSLNKNMTAAETQSLEKVFKQLRPAPLRAPRAAAPPLKEETSLQKAVAAADAKKAATMAKLHKENANLTQVNRDPNNDYSGGGAAKDRGTGLASGNVPAASHYNASANRTEIRDKKLEIRNANKPAARQRAVI